MNSNRVVSHGSTKPTLKVLGVYRPVISQEVFEEQNGICGNKSLTQQHFANLVLIEAVVDISMKSSMLRNFAKSRPKAGEQVAYNEALVSGDGELVLARDTDCVKGEPPLRFAFYLHYFDPKQPLRWTYAQAFCPAVSDAPERLQRLVPYFPTD